MEEVASVTTDRPVNPRACNRCHLLLLALLLIAAAAIRLYGITIHPAQPDERLWVGRSARVLFMLRTNPFHATTHLPHPGIPAATTMAFGQWLNEKIAHKKGHQEPRYSSREASRIAMALLASLIVPVLYFGIQPILGSWTALLATGLFAFDPKFIGLSRMAHIDTTLTLLATATILLYFHAILRKSLRLKLFAGVLWGLCLTTKPTCVAIIGIFFIWGTLFYLFYDRIVHPQTPRENWLHTMLGHIRRGGSIALGWSSFWAVIIGHLVLSFLYTRLWVHKSEYHDRMHIRIKLAGWLWRFGKSLQPYLFEITAASIVVLALSLFLFRQWKKNSLERYYHLGMIALSTGFLSLTFIHFPQVYENLARYWKWVFGLSSTSHESFGHVIVEPAGYTTFFFTQIPTLIAVGALIGTYLLAKQFFSSELSNVRCIASEAAPR